MQSILRPRSNTDGSLMPCVEMIRRGWDSSDCCASSAQKFVDHERSLLRPDRPQNGTHNLPQRRRPILENAAAARVNQCKRRQESAAA